MTKWWDAATIIWDKMVAKLDNFYNTAKDTIREVIISIFEKYKSAWTTVSSWFSDEDEEKEKEKVPEKKKPEEGLKIDPEKFQAKQNIEILADSLKSSIASDVVNKMSEEMDISSLSEEEQARYESLLRRNVKVDKGEISVDLEDVRKQIIGDAEVITYRPADKIAPEFDAMKEKYGHICKCDEDVLSCALFEQVAVKFLEAKNAPKEENEIEVFEVVIG